MDNPLAKVAEQVEDDLRKCHEAYCKSVCPIFSQGMGADRQHTPRCERLQSTWGFPAYAGVNDDTGTVT